jgi:hypothetical protein
MMVIEWYFEMQKRDRKGIRKKLRVNFDAIVGVCCVVLCESDRGYTRWCMYLMVHIHEET